MKSFMDKTWTLDEVPNVCKRYMERNMSQGSDDHEYVEIVGGPLDGKKLKEIDDKFKHSTAHQYVIDNCLYKPKRVTALNGKNVLKLEYIGPYVMKTKKV